MVSTSRQCFIVTMGHFYSVQDMTTGQTTERRQMTDWHWQALHSWPLRWASNKNMVNAILIFTWPTSSSRMHVMSYNWSARKQCLLLQSVARTSRHSALSQDRIWPCDPLLAPNSYLLTRQTVFTIWTTAISCMLVTTTLLSVFIIKHTTAERRDGRPQVDEIFLKMLLCVQHRRKYDTRVLPLI